MVVLKYNSERVLAFFLLTTIPLDLSCIEDLSRRTLSMAVVRGPARRLDSKNKSAYASNTNANAAKPGFGKCLFKWFFRIGVLALVYTVGKYLDSIRVSFFCFLLSYEVTRLILLSITQCAPFSRFSSTNSTCSNQSSYTP